MTDLPWKFLIRLTEVVASHFTLVLDEVSVLVDHPLARKDVYKQFGEIITELKGKSARERLVARTMYYIKQHASRLRHQNIPIIHRDINTTIENLNDVVVALRELVVERFRIWGLVKAVETMALSYYQVCIDFQISVINLEIYDIPQSYPEIEGPIENEITSDVIIERSDLEAKDQIIAPYNYIPRSQQPPKEMTMRWYKTHKWYDFFIGRTVTFTKGSYRDVRCIVINFNGNNTRCRFPDGTYHCIHADIPLTWSDD